MSNNFVEFLKIKQTEIGLASGLDCTLGVGNAKHCKYIYVKTLLWERRQKLCKKI